MNIGRNDKCPCGSGKKYKKCHLNKPHMQARTATTTQVPIPEKFKALIKYNQDLRGVMEAVMDKELHVQSDKHVFVAFCVGKAYKTHGALMLLCQQGYGQDAAILVRSLVDLLFTMIYILKDTTDGRLQRYFAYDWILRKRTYDYAKTKPELFKLLEERSMNLNSDDNSIEEVEKYAKLAKEKFKFGRDWSDKTIRQMAEEIGRSDLYLTVYRLQSQLMHTAPRVMNEYLKRSSNGYIIDVGQNSQWVEESLVTAFDCMYHLIGEYDKLLELGYAKKLDNIAKNYTEEIGRINTNA
jgi:hypothetical protein